MQKINLRELYPDVYKTDIYLEVTDEVQEVFLADKRAEARYLRQMYNYKAHYSLDCDNGIEKAIMQHPPTPEEILEEKQLRDQLCAAVMELFGFSFSSRFWMLIVFAVPYGLGAGAIDAALNNYIALHYKAKHMSWLHCFWGVGTIVSPFIMSYALANRTWNSGYRMVGLIQLGIALLLLVTLPVWNVNQSTSREAGKSVGLTGALKIKGVPFLLLGYIGGLIY